MEWVTWQARNENLASKIYERTTIASLFLWTLSLVEAQISTCAEDRRHPKTGIQQCHFVS